MTKTVFKGATLALALLVVAGTATAGPNVLPNFSNKPNPRWFVAPGLTVNQAAYNTAQMGKAYQQVPPWVYGYNPYPPIINVGPVIQPYPPVQFPRPLVYPGPVNPYLPVYP